MTFDEIRKVPTTVTEVPAGARGVHESCLRSWHILEKVRELVSDSAVSRDLLLDLIQMMKTDLPSRVHNA